MAARGITGVKVRVSAAALFCVLVGAIAGGEALGSADGPKAEAAISKQLRQVKRLKQQVAKLQAKVNTLSRPQGPQGPTGPSGCRGNDAADVMVSAGAVCIDRYEVSVWSSPTGGTQYGAGADDYPCSDNGEDCSNIYARSVAGVLPSTQITWFQAQQALANVGKRLPTNAEWQQAGAGTPDSSSCHIGPAGSVALTGANASCISAFGANDMVGNVWEWVADWDEEAGGCADWPAGFGGDITCIGRGSTGDTASTRFPAALLRGGSHFLGSDAGAFAVRALDLPSEMAPSWGFRGAR